MKSAATRPSSILIVDDETEILSLLKELLEPRGFEISTANSGKAALKMTEEANFSCILADLKMQGFEGVEFIRELKKIESPAKIIVMSGYGAQVIEDLHNLGVSDYIIKPIDFDDLFNKLSSFRQSNECCCRCRYHPRGQPHT